MADLKVGELAHFCVGGEGGEPVAAHVLEAQLGSLVGPLSAHDDPHPLGPGGQVQQVGDLSDVRTLPGLTVSVVRGGPCGLGDGVVDLRRVVRQREPHAVGHPPTGQELNGLLRASGPVDAHQHLSTGSGAEPGLVQCPADDLDVVGGSVRTGVSGTQHERRALTPTIGAVVEPRGQRVVAEPLLEGRGRTLFL